MYSCPALSYYNIFFMNTLSSQSFLPVPPAPPGENFLHEDASVPAAPHPVDTTERIKTVDLVRGLALFGILLMNITGFGIDGGEFFTILKGPHNTADYQTLLVIETFFSGTMRGLFSMLFGAGMILFTFNKKEAPGGVTVAEYYYRRLLWLVIFGMFNAYILLWDGDILFYYGLCGMLLYPFRNTKPKWLILIGILCIGIGVFKNMLWYNETRETRANYLEAAAAKKANKTLTEEQTTAKTNWLEMEKRQQADTVRSNRNIKKMHSGYGTIFNYFIPRNSGNETWGMYHGIWDMISMMFIGMGLLMLGFFSNKLSTSTYSLTLLLGYGVGVPLGYIMFTRGLVDSLDIGRYVDSFSVPHWVLYDLRRILLCLGHASLLMLIYRSRVVPWLMKSLSDVGQMAFTNYLMQSIICTWIFYGYGFNNYNEIKFHQLYYVVGAVWVFQLIFSTIWLKYYRFGPFEWVWRSLTYGKKQPMLKSKN